MSTSALDELEPADAAELLPGYYVDEATGAWLTLPWPPPDLGTFKSIAPQVVTWAHRWLVHPLTGDPWRFTASQLRFLALWYSLRDDGRWAWRSGVKRGAKGTGKDPFAAAICMCELMGPVAFDGWSDDGQPRAKAHRMALVQIAANSEDQAKDLLRVANAMVGQELAEQVDFDPGIKASMAGPGGRSRAEVLVRAEGSNEGDPATFLALNESHHMTASSGGQALAKVGRRNVGKSPGGQARALEFTNAHMPGNESVAEDSFNAWQQQVAGATRRVDILYDSREAPPHLRMHVPAELKAGIDAAYDDAPWVDKERIADEAEDPRTPLADSIRFYFNALPTNEFAWCDPRKFDDMAKPSIVIDTNEPMSLFLDCSKSEDATALVGSRISDGHLVTLGLWQPPHGQAAADWLVPRHEVDAVVREQFATFDVQWFGVDPSPARDDDDDALYWQELMDAWHRDYRDESTGGVLVWAHPANHAVAFDMRMSTKGGHERNRAFTEAAELMAAEVFERSSSLTWDGNPHLRSHVHNARRRRNQWGVSLSKQTRDSKKLVDLAVSAVGARLGRRLVLNSGKTRSRRHNGRVW